MIHPTEVYRQIRQLNPEDMGAHWEGVGAYISDGVWGDPKVYSWMKGEYEYLYQAHILRSQNAPRRRQP